MPYRGVVWGELPPAVGGRGARERSLESFMRFRAWVLLQVAGFLLVLCGGIETATAASAGDCRPGVAWDADREEPYVLIHEEEPGVPVEICMYYKCGELLSCSRQSIVVGGTTWAFCRCPGWDGTHPPRCELQTAWAGVPYGSPPYLQVPVNVRCVDMCGGTCAPFDANDPNCWSGPGLKVGQAKCPGCP